MTLVAGMVGHCPCSFRAASPMFLRHPPRRRLATALMAKAPELFAAPPSIELMEVLGLKNDGAV